MLRKWSGRTILFLGLAGLIAPAPLLAQSVDKAAKSAKDSKEKEKNNEFTRLRIEVTAGDDNVPVDNASVYVRYEIERKLRRDKKIEENWKTNREGVVKVPSVQRGKVLIQVIAPGWKTFGQWYELDQEEQTIKIHLQKPMKWY